MPQKHEKRNNTQLQPSLFTCRISPVCLFLIVALTTLPASSVFLHIQLFPSALESGVFLGIFVFAPHIPQNAASSLILLPQFPQNIFLPLAGG
jgi:hypothetical protein